jgi:MinD-like ATPase involved in chromosome partitioning or flagellar assembly
MAIVAVAGDVSTTTSVALASAWPATDEMLLIEVDPAGGDLAAWFDMPVSPSLSSVVTRVLDGSWAEFERHVRIAPSGLRVLPAPASRGEAARAVSEAGRSLVAMLSAERSPVVIADTGHVLSPPAAHPVIGSAAVTVVVHRQSTQSARAAAVRLHRLAEQLDAFAMLPTAVVVAVVGASPFDLGEVESFLSKSVGVHPVVGLPVDELAAAVFGGRTGLSSRRLARLPLSRATRDLAAVVDHQLESIVTGTGSPVA